VTPAFSIAHVLSSLGVGGQEQVALDLATAQRERGHPVLVVSLAPGPDGPMAARFSDAGVPTVTLGKSSRLDPKLSLRLAALFRDRGTAVVHTHNPQPLIYAAVAGRMAGAAVVHTKHGRNPGPRRWLWLRRAAAHLTDVFVAVSDVTAEQARHDRDCPDRALCVIPNGIDVAAFRSAPRARSDVRAELKIPAGSWVIGTVGRLDHYKNHSLLIAACAPLLRAGAHLVIVGEGGCRAAIEQAVRAAGRGDRVHLMGARDDVPRLMAAFDVFALSSDSEGLPLVVAEAMASQLPVVSTAVGGIPSVVRDGETGLLVPAGNERQFREALQSLDRDRDRAVAMGKSGRRVAEADYSAERMVRDYFRVYERALARSRNRRTDESKATVIESSVRRS
jgi:glycosyltransferase involved in cell wall biosynthesis